MENVKEWVENNPFGTGAGDGDGAGFGDGAGTGTGYGDGTGPSCGVEMFGGKKVFEIDGLQTIITRTRGTFAHGFILNSDFTLEPCFVVKRNGYFAHGKTLREAVEALREKIFENMNSDEAKEAFLKKFKLDQKYPGTDFFEWHHYLTGSCLMGREAFVRNKGLDLNDEFTVSEFIEICENDYGGQIIRELKERIKER